MMRSRWLAIALAISACGADDNGAGGSTGATGNDGGAPDGGGADGSTSDDSTGGSNTSADPTDGGDGDGTGGDDGTGDGDAPLPGSATFVEMGAPPGGYRVITDLVTFRDRLYLATSQDPLGAFGTSVYYTQDGTSFTEALSDGSSQGYLRMRVIGDKLYIPDGDPNGYDPSYVYISEDGDDFERTTVHGGLHTFDVIEYEGDLLCSNGMNGGGGLCKLAGSDWNQVAGANYARLKYMAEFGGRLYVALWNMNGDGVDFVRWSANVGGAQAEGVDAIPGDTTTFRWYTSSQPLLYSSLAVLGDRATVQYTEDGDVWHEVPAFASMWVSAFAELQGNMYALSTDALWGSADGVDFVQLGNVTGEPFGPVAIEGGYNADGTASMAAYDGHLWCGSSQNGKLYRVDFE
jgi:hypothetical protein